MSNEHTTPSAAALINRKHGIGHPAAFLLGVATTCLLRAVAPTLERKARPLLTRAFKQGIRLTRAARGAGEQIGAVVADSYAQARLELEQEEGAEASQALGGNGHKNHDHG